MSATLAAIRARVRFHLRDRDLHDAAFSTFEVDDAINSALKVLGSRLRLGLDWVSNALSISNAADTYTLPGTNQYKQVIAFRLVSEQTVIPVIPRGEFDAYREGATNPSVNGTGDPEYATVWEDTAQATKVQFYPWPKDADTVDMLRTTLPAALATASATAPFDDLGVEALCFRAAAYLLGKSSDDILSKLRLSRESAAMYNANAEEAIRESRYRHARMAGASRSNMTARRW